MTADIADLTALQVSQFSAVQVGYLSGTQVAAIEQTDIGSLDLASLSQTQIAAITADQITGISTTKIATIGPDSYPGHYVVPLPTNLATYLAEAAPGQRIKGDYTLTFACRDTLSTADLQVFTAELTVDGKGRYQAQGDSATPIDQLIDGYVPGSAGFAYGDPAAPDAEAVAEYAAEQVAADDSADQAFPWRVLLIAAGVLLLLGAAYSWWKGRAQTPNSGGPDGKANDEESVDAVK